MSTKKIEVTSPNASGVERENALRLKELFRHSPTGGELLDEASLYQNRQHLMRQLFFNGLYQQIINVHGVVMEFGCKWGKNLALFTALRGIYEPYNHNRKLLGFDTFDGLRGVSSEDPRALEGSYATSKGYEEHLRSVLDCLEQECPLAHIKKHEIIPGDVRETLPAYLKQNPHTIIALAYFDMDIYEPTKVALEAVLPHLTRGSILGFDECNWDAFPGPTRALDEVIGKGKYKIQRSPLQPIPGYLVID